MKIGKTIGISVIAAIVVTLITGIINVTPGGLVGAVWYGFPLNWINKLITYPTAWAVQWAGLVVDLVVWFIVAMIVLFLIGMARKHK